MSREAGYYGGDIIRNSTISSFNLFMQINERSDRFIHTRQQKHSVFQPFRLKLILQRRHFGNKGIFVKNHTKTWIPSSQHRKKRFSAPRISDFWYLFDKRRFVRCPKSGPKSNWLVISLIWGLVSLSERVVSLCLTQTIWSLCSRYYQIPVSPLQLHGKNPATTRSRPTWL